MLTNSRRRAFRDLSTDTRPRFRQACSLAVSERKECMDDNGDARKPRVSRRCFLGEHSKAVWTRERQASRHRCGSGSHLTTPCGTTSSCKTERTQHGCIPASTKRSQTSHTLRCTRKRVIQRGVERRLRFRHPTVSCPNAERNS